MKPSTIYLPSGVLIVLCVLLWLSLEGPDASKLAGKPSTKDVFPDDRMSADGETGMRSDKGRAERKSPTGERSLTARARATAIQGILDRNADLLREAIRMSPNDPYLLFLGATHSLLTPEEKLEHGRRFFERDSQNAFAAFLHATHLLKSGDSAAALAILGSSGTRPDYSDYTGETFRLMETAMIRSGHSPAEAKWMVFSKLEAGYLIDLRDAVGSLVHMTGGLPADEAASMRSIASYMGRRISDESKSGTIISQLVGLVMEKKVLEGMGEDQPSPYDGLTVAEARASIEVQRRQIMELSGSLPNYEQLLRDDPQVLNLYFERMMQDGEVEALKWLRDKR
jgi:hypothetical protein